MFSGNQQKTGRRAGIETRKSDATDSTGGTNDTCMK